MKMLRACGALVGLWPVVGHADERIETIITSKALAAGSIDDTTWTNSDSRTTDITVKESGKRCPVAATAQPTCPDLFQSAPSDEVVALDSSGNPLYVARLQDGSAMGTLAWESSSGTLSVPGAPVGAAYLFVPKLGWSKHTVAAGGKVVVAPAAIAGSLNAREDECRGQAEQTAGCKVVLRMDPPAVGKFEPEWTLDFSGGEAAPNPASGRAFAGTAGGNGTFVPSAISCKSVLEDLGRQPAYCLDLTAGGQSRVALTDGPDTILRPDTAVTAVVIHVAGKSVEISADGTRGVFTPGVDQINLGQRTAGGTQDAGKGAVDQPTIAYSQSTFAPRTPGHMDITAKVDGTTFKVAELEIATTYASAIRIGVGVNSVVDGAWAAQKINGSDVAEIVQTSGAGTTMSPELVVGFAPFWFDKGGRQYVYPEAGRAAFLKKLAPYLGLGIAGLDTESTLKFELLHSVYLGGELEFVHHSSVAVAFALRQVDRLQAPYEVGDPFEGSTVPVSPTYLPGFAVIFNVSPEFLTFAQQYAK